MNIPNSLQTAIENVINDLPPGTVSDISSEISKGYRFGGSGKNGVIKGREETYAYAAYRMPATYAAVSYVLGQLNIRKKDFRPLSFMDAGAGPGTAMWAALGVYDSIEVFNLYERNCDMINTGKDFMGYLPDEIQKRINWINSDITGNFDSKKHDIVVTSYVLNEINDDKREDFLKKLWDCTGITIAIIEPGTPEGYRSLQRARTFLQSLGAKTVAPCPHEQECGLTGNDWCHFSQRVSRTKFLRMAKNASLSYEDEKFSYIIMSREYEGAEIKGVVIRHPQVRKGHIMLETCTIEGIYGKVISKKNVEEYKNARKSEWGSVIY